MRRLILLGVLACRSDAPVAAEAGPRDAAVTDARDPIRDAAIDGGEDTVITALHDLARALADRKITVAQLTAQLGSRTPARGRAVHVAPTDARFADAVIVRGPDGLPAQVKLELAQPVVLGELRQAFGDYEVDAQGRPLAAWPVAFVRAVRGPAASVSLFADVAHAGAGGRRGSNDGRGLPPTGSAGGGRRGSIDQQTTAHVTLQIAAP